jgi:predicted Zn-dependent peptidase
MRCGGAVVVHCRLDDLAAGIESGAGQQSLTIDFECEAGDAPEVLQLLSELVLQPLLPEDKLELIKAQVYNLLEHQNDNATAIAARWVGGGPGG